METFQISCSSSMEEHSKKGELTLGRALSERGVEGSIGVLSDAKTEDKASAQVQKQETAQNGGECSSIFIGPVINKDSCLYGALLYVQSPGHRHELVGITQCKICFRVAEAHGTFQNEGSKFR